MAIYAFDGTWQDDKNLEEFVPEDSNVSKFLYACGLKEDDKSYLNGVGTKLGRIGRIIGGLFGVGGRSRVREMMARLRVEFEEEGDEVIVIIGYSRGAALALHFANLIAESEFKRKGSGETIEGPPIHFLGLFDTVASFGFSLDYGLIDTQRINIGWDLSVPANVLCCRHALAFDEVRETFRPTRLDPGGTNPAIEEVWFRGGHGDVGGGNGNMGLSNISLGWMIDEAERSLSAGSGEGLAFDDAHRNELRKKENAAAPPRLAKLDPIKDPPRATLPGDQFHESFWKRLKVGEEHQVEVEASEPFVCSDCLLHVGEAYIFSFEGEWKDGDVECGPNGWTRADVRKGLMEIGIAAAERWRRVKAANWFELIGTMGRNEKGHFRIGNGQFSDDNNPFIAPCTDVLFYFPNDLSWVEFNNKGKITVSIRRVG